MILYKYVPFEAGKKILDGNSVLFAQPKTFNDPFDMPACRAAIEAALGWTPLGLI